MSISTLTNGLIDNIVIKKYPYCFSELFLAIKSDFSISINMCSLAVSTQDSLAVERRSNPDSGKILMSENLRLYATSPVVMC